MEEIKKTYRQALPATRFIGKKYNAAAGEWGDYGAWFGGDWFGTIERAAGGAEAVRGLYEDGGAFLNMLLRDKNSQPLEFWIGMFTAPETPVPDGFQFMDFAACDLGVCWIYGRDIQFYKVLDDCLSGLVAAGMELKRDANGSFWAIERDCCPRYTASDENGNIIADYCFFVK